MIQEAAVMAIDTAIVPTMMLGAVGFVDTGEIRIPVIIITRTVQVRVNIPCAVAQGDRGN